MNCEYEFPDRYFSNISKEALDLVKQMLAEDVNVRITAKKALEHPWFKKEFNKSAQDREHTIQRMQNQSEFDKQRKQLQ